MKVHLIEECTAGCIPILTGHLCFILSGVVIIFCNTFDNFCFQGIGIRDRDTTEFASSNIGGYPKEYCYSCPTQGVIWCLEIVQER